MIELVKKSVLDKLLNKDETYVIGVSTGIDSMSLFFYLKSLGYKLVVAHINHKKRKESDNEYLFLEDYCKKNDVFFEGYVINEHLEGNFQEEARKVRYNFYRAICDKYKTNKIIVCHQLDDVAETVIMRLTRGTSIRGYSGIQDRSVVDGYEILRPLLYTSRDQIIEFQKENNVPYFEDSSNKSDDYTRNQIRHNVIPTLKSINPDFLNQILDYKKDQEDAFSLIDSLSKDFLSSFGEKKEKELSFPVEEFNKLEDIVKRQVILLSINYVSNNSVEATHQKIEEIARFGDITNEGKKIEIKGNYACYNEYGKLAFVEDTKKEFFELELHEIKEYELDGYGRLVLSQKTHSLSNKNSYILCYNNNQSPFPITVRNPRFGDKIQINGITKKVFDVFKEYKVPRRLRDSWLIFENKDGIFFIPGLLRKETDRNALNALYITLEEDLEKWKWMMISKK